jgi:amidohydrolase
MAQNNSVLDQQVKAVYPKLIEWRRHIHENPELGNREFKQLNILLTI